MRNLVIQQNQPQRSAALHERACLVMPGGNSRETVYVDPYPIYARSGAGAYVTDVEGVTRLDCVNNASSLIHGHCHPRIVEAVQKQAGRLMCVAMPTETEVDLAEILVERLPSVEQVRFCNSGSEAVMFAVKCARAYTGRRLLLKVEGSYHGSYDPAEVSTNPAPESWGDIDRPRSIGTAQGVPDGIVNDVVTVPYNDIPRTRAILERLAPDIAAVLVDPLVSRMNFVAASVEYLQFLREFTSRNRSLLIFDEVYSFRLGYNGAQGKRGVLPDLTTLGKIIGGGLPIGAVGGTRDVMSVFDPSRGKSRVPHMGTFNANPMSMVAGRASMELLTPDRFEYLGQLGDRMRQGLDEAFRIAAVDGYASGEGSLVAVNFNRDAYTNYREYHAASSRMGDYKPVFLSLLGSGIFASMYREFVLSTVMTTGDVDRVCEAFLHALRTTKA